MTGPHPAPGLTAAPASTPPIVRRGRVDSTQTVAFTLAAQGAPDRTVVVADSQAAGRGRRGRTWQDEPGASLLTSIIVRPRLAPARLPALSLATGVAVAEALAAVAGLAARLRWPNDVMVGARKIAGILLETRMLAESPAAAPAPVVVVGIGVNLAQRRFSPDLETRATSVARETGRAVERDVTLAAVLAAFDGWRHRLEREGFAPVRARWLTLSDTIGQPVTVEGVHGVAVGLDDDGALLVRTDGTVRRVVAGELAAEGHADAPGR